MTENGTEKTNVKEMKGREVRKKGIEMVNG